MRDDRAARAFLALDLGAESGRAIVVRLCSGVLVTEEIRRFKNEPVEYGGSLHWDVGRLWWELQNALESVKDRNLAGIGVDAWGVDYALLGERGELLQNPYHYRDARTRGVMHEVFRKCPREEIYSSTGIQFMEINTLYQLYAAARGMPSLVKAAKKLVMIPDLFHYWLTGEAVCEYTNATTTQLVNPGRRTWAGELMEKLELPKELLSEIVEPGTRIGSLLPNLSRGAAISGTPVIAPATHDTGSAVAAIAAREGTAFISSGTWSLVGTELDAPVISPEALRLNFTNEGGVNGTTRLLKNVMGLWMLQCCRQSWTGQGRSYGHDDLMELAAREEAYLSLVDPDHPSFLRPPDMLAAMDQFCVRTHQPIPKTAGAYVRAILESLAMKYRLVLRDLEQLIGRPIDKIRVIGGGSKNRLLNQMTADATGRSVLAGPAEATAIGNAAMQIVATGGASSLSEVRRMVDRSFPVDRFEPLKTDEWNGHAERFEQYCGAMYA